MNAHEVHLADAAATRQAGRDLASRLADGAVVAIDGPMGAGKTTFVRGVATALGVPEAAICSPSFTIVMEHPLPDGRMVRHMDAWRLGGPEALLELGWSQLAGAPGTITLVEWAQRIESALPEGTIRLELAYSGDGRVLVSDAAPGDAP